MPTAIRTVPALARQRVAGTGRQVGSAAVVGHVRDEHPRAEVGEPPHAVPAGELADEPVEVTIGVELDVTGAPERQPVAHREPLPGELDDKIRQGALLSRSGSGAR